MESSNSPEQTPTVERARAAPGRLNAEWREFFRNSLRTAEPGPETDPAHNPDGTPASLPPPIRTATNAPSGDAFDTKSKDAFRLWYINANGISSKNGFAALHSLCVSLKTKFVDAIAIQEPNTDFMQPYLRQKYQESFKEHFGQAKVLTATTYIDAPKSWKHGGVVLAILGSWAQHVTQVSCDDLGWWVSATLTGSDGDIIIIYSVYNVVDVKLQDAGPVTVYSQQYRLLRLAGVTFPSTRQQCVIDLQSAIAKSVANQEAIIIVGDFNEQLGRLPNLMTSVFVKNDLLNVHARFHGIAADIPTYARGTTRLDYCGASVQLTDFIHSSGFNLFNEHFHSDHRASFVDIHLKSFFGHDTPTALARPEHRFVTSFSANVSKFVQKTYSHLHEH
jgi:hypothetical protein